MTSILARLLLINLYRTQDTLSAARTLVPQHQSPQNTLSQAPAAFIVHLSREETTKSIPMDSHATAADLYEAAQSVGMLDKNEDVVLKEDGHGGQLIFANDNIVMTEILDPFENPEIIQNLTVNVLAYDRITISIHITNMDKKLSFTAHSGMNTDDIYHEALKNGMMENFDQFLLTYDGDPSHSIFGWTTDPFGPASLLLHSIDPHNPDELRLSVHPVPEGVLLYIMFWGMSPNENLPFLKYAQFCLKHPWHPFCDCLSKIHKFDGSAGYSVISIRKQHYIYVDGGPLWSGQMTLAHIPRTVRLLSLKGNKIRLRASGLWKTKVTELVLQFETIEGFNVADLSGTSLEVLRFPCYGGFFRNQVDEVLEMLNRMRALGLIKLQIIEFADGVRIIYDSTTRRYTYIQSDSVSEPDEDEAESLSLDSGD